MLYNSQKTKPLCKIRCSGNLTRHLLTAHRMISISSFCSCLLVLNLKQVTLEAFGYCTTAGVGSFPGSFLFSTCPRAALLRGLTVHSLSSYLRPSEFEKSVADVAPKSTNTYLSLHTQLHCSIHIYGAEKEV